MGSFCNEWLIIHSGFWLFPDLLGEVIRVRCGDGGSNDPDQEAVACLTCRSCNRSTALIPCGVMLSLCKVFHSASFYMFLYSSLMLLLLWVSTDKWTALRWHIHTHIFYHLKLLSVLRRLDQHRFPQRAACLSTCCTSVPFKSPRAEPELTFSWFELTLGPDIYQLFIMFCSACANLNVSHHGNSLLSQPEGVSAAVSTPTSFLSPGSLCSTFSYMWWNKQRAASQSGGDFI